jgi:undecaprenyl-diphosphatase
MLPAAFIGLVFEEQIGTLFEGQLLLIGAMLALTGILLFSQTVRKKLGKVFKALMHL